MLALAALASGALAHSDSKEHGTVTFHDSPDGQAQASATIFADPVETECQMWIRGYGMSHQQGTIEARLGLSLTAEAQVLGEWNGTENEDGTFDFVAGPFTLEEEGNWTVWVNLDGHETRDHDVRHKVCKEEPITRPECPLNVRIDVNSDNEVRLDWNASARAEAFAVYRAQANDSFRKIAEVNATTHLDAQVDANVTYDYRVVAINEAGESKDCRVLQISIPALNAPSCPLNVQLRVTADLVALTWNAPERAEAFLILRGDADAELHEIARVNGTAFVDLDVNLGNERRSSLAYVVVAINAHGQAKDCPPVKVDEPPKNGGDGAPECSTNLQAHPEESEEIRLTWDAGEGADSYRVYRATEGSPFERIGEINSTGFVDSDTQADQTYRYRVTSVNEAGESKGCPTVEATAIPFFGSWLLVGLAALGSVAAVAALHRKRG